jgi:hypothetical protein
MKGVTDIRGVRDIRGMQGSGRRAIPRAHSSAYLDLYVLGEEQERLEREAGLLEKRARAIGKRLGDIQRQMGVLEKCAQGERVALSNERPEGRNGPRQPWKTFPLEY